MPIFISPSTYLLGAILLVSIYGFVLFAWWWYRVGRATEVYAYVTGLYFTIGWAAFVAIYGRWIHANYNEVVYTSFQNSYKWYMPFGGIFLIMLIVASRMTRRVYRTYMYRRGFREDRRHAPDSKIDKTKEESK